MKRFVAAVTLAILSAGSGAAQDASQGAELYTRHCASCHGIGAAGDGPMSPVLLIQPSDLTTMTERYNGVFPKERVVMRIDGRDPLVSHGSPMPVYGDFFEGEDIILKTETGQPVLTSVPVADLLAYLEGLQN